MQTELPPSYRASNASKAGLLIPVDTKEKKKAFVFRKPWIWALVCLLVILAIVGGLVGSILASRMLRQNDVPSQSDTSQDKAPDPPAKETPPAAEAKFSSITSSKVFNESLLQVFYLQNTSLQGSVFNGEAWVDLGNLNPTVEPKPKSPLAAIAFLESGNVQVRLITLLHEPHPNSSTRQSY